MHKNKTYLFLDHIDFPRVCISCWSLKSIRHCRSRSRRGIFKHFVIAAFFNTQVVLWQNGFGSVLLTGDDWFIDIGFKKLLTYLNFERNWREKEEKSENSFFLDTKSMEIFVERWKKQCKANGGNKGIFLKASLPWPRKEDLVEDTGLGRLLSAWKWPKRCWSE